MMHNGVNIQRMMKDIDRLRDDVEMLKDKVRKKMEVVISLLMFLGEPPVLKEHLLMPSISECLRKKRIATRKWSNALYQCSKVKAVVKDGKIISISSLE